MYCTNSTIHVHVYIHCTSYSIMIYATNVRGVPNNYKYRDLCHQYEGCVAMWSVTYILNRFYRTLFHTATQVKESVGKASVDS